MVPYLRGQQLFHFVDGSGTPPPRFLPNSTIPNLDFLTCTQIDQLILSALISTLSDNLITQVVGYSITREVWYTLDTLFTSQSHARVIQLRYQLATISKVANSISDYYRKLKHLSDTMCAAGIPLTCTEFISYLLAGLNSDYDAFVTFVTTHIEPMSPKALYGLLLTHESCLAHSTHLPASTHLSENFTSTPSFHGRGASRGNTHGNFCGCRRG